MLYWLKEDFRKTPLRTKPSSLKRPLKHDLKRSKDYFRKTPLRTQKYLKRSKKCHEKRGWKRPTWAIWGLVFRYQVRTVGASRTDGGVHAKGSSVARCFFSFRKGNYIEDMDFMFTTPIFLYTTPKKPSKAYLKFTRVFWWAAQSDIIGCFSCLMS